MAWTRTLAWLGKAYDVDGCMGMHREEATSCLGISRRMRASRTLPPRPSHTVSDMAEVMEEEGQAFCEACEAGDVEEVTRMLQHDNAACLVNWKDSHLDSVRIVLGEEAACGSPMNVIRDGIS